MLPRIDEGAKYPAIHAAEEILISFNAQNVSEYKMFAGDKQNRCYFFHTKYYKTIFSNGIPHTVLYLKFVF